MFFIIVIISAAFAVFTAALAFWLGVGLKVAIAIYFVAGFTSILAVWLLSNFTKPKPKKPEKVDNSQRVCRF